MNSQGLPNGTRGDGKSCQTCDKGMSGSYNLRRCRIHGREIDPESMQARYVEQHGCEDWGREPGSDDQPWYSGGWCVTSSTEGRGD